MLHKTKQPNMIFRKCLFSFLYFLHVFLSHCPQVRWTLLWAKKKMAGCQPKLWIYLPYQKVFVAIFLFFWLHAKSFYILMINSLALRILNTTRKSLKLHKTLSLKLAHYPLDRFFISNILPAPLTLNLLTFCFWNIIWKAL